MANSFINIPVPAANGAGAAVAVDTLGKTKTFVIGGGFRATVNVEVSAEEPPVVWAPLATFHQSGNVTIDVACNYVRAVTSEYVSGAPNLDVGADASGSQFQLLPANGASADVSLLPEFKTVIAPPGFVGNVELSEDGTSWAQVFSFTDGGILSRSFVAQFGRVIGAVDGTPVAVSIVGANAAGGGGGTAAPQTRPPGTVFDYLEDFLGGAAPDQFTVVATGGATSIGPATSQLPIVGMLGLITNNTNDTIYCYVGRTQIELNEAAFTQLVIEWGGSVDLFGNQGSFCTRFLANSNLVPSLVGGNGNCLSFALGDDQNGNANWWGILDDATRYDLGIANDTNYHRFKIVYNPGVNVQWYIDDVLRATHLGSPSVAGQSVFVGANAVTGVVGFAPGVNIDYVWIHMELPRP